MGWDRKKRGASTGYYYLSKRVPGKLHPVKQYFGRKSAGQLCSVPYFGGHDRGVVARDRVAVPFTIVVAHRRP